MPQAHVTRFAVVGPAMARLPLAALRPVVVRAVDGAILVPGEVPVR